MIDLDKVLGVQAGIQALAQQQVGVNQSANAAPAAQPQSAAASQPNGQLFAQLGALINQASSQPAQPNEQMADLQQQAALLSATVNDLVSAADALEASLNMTPTPEQIDVGTLFSQIKDIMDKLNQELSALNKKIAEKDKENDMTLKQKPTALKPGEDSADLSFNQTLSVQ